MRYAVVCPFCKTTTEGLLSLTRLDPQVTLYCPQKPCRTRRAHDTLLRDECPSTPTNAPRAAQKSCSTDESSTEIPPWVTCALPVESALSFAA